MSGAYSTNGEIRNAYVILVGEFEAKGPHREWRVLLQSALRFHKGGIISDQLSNYLAFKDDYTSSNYYVQ
jgi:hypothetical protein